jgi:hypothetical protein
MIVNSNVDAASTSRHGWATIIDDDAASNIYNRRLLKQGIDADEHNKHNKKYVDRSHHPS